MRTVTEKPERGRTIGCGTICHVDREALRRELAARPHAVRFDELRALLEAYGWEVRHGKGSHHVFRRGPARVVIPFRRGHVLPIYVRLALRATAETEQEEEAHGDDDAAE